MLDVSDTITKWEVIHTAAGPGGLNRFVFNTPKANYGGSSSWLYLEGFDYHTSGKIYNAHITITKKDGALEWTFCHFTVTRARTSHAFYEVNDNGSYGTTQKLIDKNGKQKNGEAHYPKDHINDATLMNDIEHDLTIIFNYLA